MFDVINLFYDPERNAIFDDCGFMVFDIYKLITPNRLFLFKKQKQHMSTWDEHGDLIVLYYGEGEDRNYEY
jgi:hypothetical protein